MTWRSSRREYSTLALVCVAAASATTLATYRYGTGLTPDSLVYVNGARSLAAGRGYVSGHAPITSFAPGYSALLSVGQRVGIDAIDGARVVGVVAFAVTIALGYVLLKRYVRSPKIIVAGTIAIGFSAALLQVFEEALSEHLFVVITLAFLLVSDTVMRSPRRIAPIAALVPLTWGAFYARYAGVVFVLIAAVIVLIAVLPVSRQRALLTAGSVALCGLALPLVWMKRNVDAGAGLLGTRQESASGFIRNLSRTAFELSTWVAPEWVPLVLRAACMVALVAVVVVAVVRWNVRLPADSRRVAPLVVFVSLYLIYLVVSASFVAFAAINTRFMSPVFVPLVVLVGWSLERARPQVSFSVRRAMTVVACVWLVAATVTFGVDVLSSARHGAGGYASARWHDSRLMEDVRRLDSSVPIYSNDAGVIELFTGRIVSLSVAKTFFASNEETGNLPQFVRAVECAGLVKLVWFLPNARPRLYSPTELEDHLNLDAKVSRRDGVIYDVTPAPGAGASRSSCR